MKKWWKRGVLFAVVGILSAVGPLAAQVRFETGSTDSVRRMAQQQGKLVFIDLYADWCPPCRSMERQVFSRADVGEFMARHFVAAKYNVDQTLGRELLAEYGRGSIPLYLIFDTEGNLWGRIEGAASADTFLKNLRSVIDKYEKREKK
ncbi:MAG: thioredoxin family protein [Alistipes senegalensis]|nr:thioredoxin family protein [Bacteroides cellulosilyticus]MCM1352634.1 thioredoxin family protein [Alistipes senegalensis]